MKLAVLIHFFLWPASMSVLMLVALSTPACEDQLGFWLAASAGVSFVASAPASVKLAEAARRLMA